MKYAAIFIVLVVLILVVLNWKKLKAGIGSGSSQSNGGQNGNTTVFVNPITQKTETLDYNKRLTKGSRGNEVTQLQIWLNQALRAKGKTTIAEDGAFGSGTAAALKEVTGRSDITLKAAQELMNNAAWSMFTAGVNPNLSGGYNNNPDIWM